METPAAGHYSRLGLLLILAVVLLLRLPFLHQAIQGDDVYYLAAAEHAQIEPLHPKHVQYVFLGDLVDLRGHPHPPLNDWALALLLALTGDIREVPFHAGYIVFSLIAAVAMWSLAKRFSPQPLWAALLFLATPAFVINGSSLESDLPFLAFWMAGFALFVTGHRKLAALALALAALGAYQAIFATPIQWVYVWLHDRKNRIAWAVTLTPPVMLLAWQLFERLSTGALPAKVLSGYLQAYNFQALTAKLASAAALSVHACFLIFPALLPGAAILAWRRRREPDTLFLLSWIGLFFAGAVVVFFAGSARYLLPIAPPLALLASHLRAKWLAAGFAAQIVLSLALAVVNYQHWDGYRQFAESLRGATANRRVWINADWGLRYYLEADGGIALQHGQAIRPGDVVVSSALFSPVELQQPLVPLARKEIRPWIPLRLIGLDARSGYSTSSKGLRPFDISTGPIDQVRAEMVSERHPTLTDLPMNAPEAPEQIVSGIYSLEGASWRWMAGRAVVVLKSPAAPTPLRATFTVPPASPVHRVQLLLDDRVVASLDCPKPGTFTITSAPLAPAEPTATVALVADRTFSVSGDRRELSTILSVIGFSTH
ncbi:MAG TPA: hypothetical protein VG672_11710 [Bryobacteraceae bacterium]|nr:hypothetical protein [Bryobacteraceae bacterium]